MVPIIFFLASAMAVVILRLIFAYIPYNGSPIAVMQAFVPRCAAEIRWATRLRPPPDPDSRNLNVRLIIACLLSMFAMYSCHISRHMPSYSPTLVAITKMMNPNATEFTPGGNNDLDGVVARLQNEMDEEDTMARTRPRHDTIPRLPTRRRYVSVDPMVEEVMSVASSLEDATSVPEGASNQGNTLPDGTQYNEAFKAFIMAEVEKKMAEREAAREAEIQREVDRRMAESQDARDTGMVAEVIGTAVKAALEADREHRPNSARSAYSSMAEPEAADEEEVMEVDGMTFRVTPRTDEEIEEDSAQITQEARFRLSSKDKDKLKSCACKAMKNEFRLMDYKALTKDGADEKDFGSELLAQQLQRQSFGEWTVKYGTKRPFLMPNVTDFSDPFAVARAPKINLLTDYKKVKPAQVFGWQKFINEYMSRPYAESSSWAYDKLSVSIESKLLVQLKQSLSRRPKPEQGGISLYYLTAIALDNNDHQNKQLITDYLSDTKLSDVKEEDVSVFFSRYSAAAHALKLRDVPSDIVEKFLENIKECQTEIFVTIVDALIGNYHADDIETDPVILLQKLEFIGQKLKTKYLNLIKAKKWTAASSPSRSPSGFQARSSNRPVDLKPRSDGLVPPNPKWQAWWDRSTCDLCGGKHPTRYCHDQGARNRYWDPTKKNSFSRTARQDARSRARPAQGFKGRQIKSPENRKKFEKRVHNTWLELSEPIDEMEANVAMDGEGNEQVDEEPDMYVNLADNEDDGADEETADDGDDDVAMARALAAMGLGSLNL